MTPQEPTVTVPGENPWQQYARRAQSAWREANGWSAGSWPGKPDTLLGSRLTEADGAAGCNFLTPAAWAMAQASITAAKGGKAMVHEDRMLTNLLSSQPLCFNLFADLAADPSLATDVLGRIWPSIAQVTAIEFEYNPHRGDPDYTGTRTAFDVFVAYTHTDGGSGFLGMEVKYHEDLSGKGFDLHKAKAADRLIELSRARLGIEVGGEVDVARSPLWQIWLDHLLAESYLDRGDFEHGEFIFLYPAGNNACAKAWDSYAALTGGHRQDLRLETLVDALDQGGCRDLAEALRSRYLPSFG